MSLINRLPDHLREEVEFYNNMMRNSKDLMKSRHPQEAKEILRELKKLEKQFKYWLGELSKCDISVHDACDEELTELLDNLKIWYI